MIVHYRNYKKESLSEAQASSEEQYIKVLVDPVTLLDKTIYYYAKGRLQSIGYYIEDFEDEKDKIDELKAITPLFNLIKRSVIKGKKVEIVRDFAGNIMHFKTRFLFDCNNHIICEEVVDINTNLPNLKKTTKYLFDADGQEILIAEYNVDGSLSVITYKPEGGYSWQDDWEYYEATDIAELEKKMCIDLRYYRTAQLDYN